jgi:thioester reductase-like protein
LTVIDADLNNSNWHDQPQWTEWVRSSKGFDVLHSAANWSFDQRDSADVYKTNVIGTTKFLCAFSGLPNIHSFNYVSTAYVAGNTEGLISESRNTRPRKFTNAYEESKWLAEGVVLDIGTKLNIDIRIFRPSIIIGHSKTFCITVKNGFYNVVDLLLQLKHLPVFKHQSIEVPAKKLASLNLIPIDLVVMEMMDVIHANEKSINQIFHITNEKPISIDDLLFGLSPLTGVTLSTRSVDVMVKPANKASSMLSRALRQYLPYFSYVRTFDRQNVHACGAGQHQQNYWLDLTALRAHTRAFIEEAESSSPVVKAEVLTDLSERMASSTFSEFPTTVIQTTHEVRAENFGPKLGMHRQSPI